MKKTAITLTGVLAALVVAGGVSLYHKEAPRYEEEQAALLAELEEYRGAYNEYALSLSCNYNLARKIADAAHGSLEMKEGADFGTLRLEGQTAEEVVASGDLISYIPYLSPEFYLYPATVEGTLSDTYAATQEKYLYSRIGLGENGEVRELTKGSTQKHTSRVVVIDTGIDYDHEEFVDEEGNSRVSELSYSVRHGKTVKEGGWDIIDDASYMSGGSEVFHGTATAGAIFASGNNAKGIAGIAEDVELIMVKMPLTADGGYEVDSFRAALDYVLTLDDVDVVNLSLGFFYSSNPFGSRLSQLKKKGAVIIGAGGNSRRTDAHYPSADPNVIGVGAFASLLNKTGTAYDSASYSAFGDLNVNIVAPGTFYTTTSGGYKVMNGTSLASPVVAAAVALYRSLDPDATPDEIAAKLYASADDQGVAGKDYTFGYGGLNVHRFLTGKMGTVTFDFGTAQETRSFMLNTPLSNYPFPASLPAGRTFGGWYLDAAYTQPVTYYKTVLQDGAKLYAKWERTETDGAFDYAIDGSNVYIKGYYGASERMILPSSLNIGGREYPVVGISAHAFQKKTSFKRLILPDTVKKVEEYAFAENEFTYLYLPSTLTSVGKYAINGTSGTVYVQGEVKTVQNNVGVYDPDWNIAAKAEVAENQGAFTLENGMALLGDSTRTLLFYLGGGELSLESEGGMIVAVADDALAGSPITAISMPNVISVGARAFENCKNLAKIDASILMTLGESAFENCTALTEVALSQFLTAIPDRAFAGCGSLVRISVQTPLLETIGSAAFQNCTALEAIDLSNATKLKSIDSYAFENCTALFLAVLPDSLNSVSAGVFKGCEQLVSVSTPFLGNGSTTRTHLGFLFGSSYSDKQQVPSTLRYVFVTRDNLAADALKDLSGLRILAKGRNNGTVGQNEVLTGGNFARMEITCDGILCGLIGGATGGALAQETLQAAYFVPAGYTANLTDFPTTLTTRTVELTSAQASYTISFYDGDRQLSSQTYSYGEKVTVPATPTRSATQQYTYEFIGWGKSVTLAVKDEVYTAQFKEVLRVYTVRFYDENRTLIKMEECDYGTSPTPPALSDRYTDDAQYYDKFMGWGKEVVPVTGDTDYTAVYTQTVRSYTVTFRYDSEEGEIIEQMSVQYGTRPTAPDSTRPADKVYSYTFLNWNTEIVAVTGEATYYAVYQKTFVEYTVRFLNWDGTELKTQQLHYGETPTPPADPSRASDEDNDYVFIGWGNVTAVTENKDYTAQYRTESKFVTIKFLDYKSELIEEQHVARGAEITPPTAPERPSTNPGYYWVFKEWSPAITPAVADAIYIAFYTQVYNEFTIKFVDWDDTVLSEQTLRFGAKVTPPASPTRAADKRYVYTFAGWDSAVTTVDGNKTYKATYKTETVRYTVRFLDKDGGLISEQKYEYEATITPPTPPVVEGYEFNGWDKQLAPVTEDTEYRATYRESTQKPPDEEKEPSGKKGCGSEIGAIPAVFSAITLAAVVFTVIKKKKIK